MESFERVEVTLEPKIKTAHEEHHTIIEKGIDVSNWQGIINWEKVADAGVKHVCIKMTEGASYVDARFQENWKGAKQFGINVNCYHYFRAIGSTSELQMENIRRNLMSVDFDPQKNILAIDVEAEGNENADSYQMADKLDSLLSLIKSDMIHTIIYTSHGFWNYKVKWEKYKFSDYPLWIAHWGPQTPVLPKPWILEGKTWKWWQYSSKGCINGIEGNVDLDRIKIIKNYC